MTPTQEQSNIINAAGHIVVVARPGSGKTFVLSEKIRLLIPLLKEYEGVIAISFTNKASSELRERTLKGGFEKKESFFGTIHKFYISEFILSFGKQIFGLPVNEIDFIDIKESELDNEERSYLEFLEKNFNSSDPTQLDYIKNMFVQGKIYLNLVELYAIYIFNHSQACREYLRSMKLKSLGLIAIAVGDLDQSIYAFTGKSSKYLAQLHSSGEFKTFSLTRNHRCHPSIINYSLSLMSDNIELLETDDIRVYHRNITGNESCIAKWIDENIKKIVASFGAESLSDVAILTSSHRTAAIIDNTMKTPHRINKQSSLEEHNYPVSQLFHNILKFTYNAKFTITETIEMFISIDTLRLSIKKELKSCFLTIESLFNTQEPSFENVKIVFEQISKILLPTKNQDKSLLLLEKVLNDELDIYKIISNNEIQIMTLHKSKGLEFDIVFHLDLYEWVLPNKKPGENDDFDNLIYGNWNQDLNLHYVGVTRAKKACILCTSTKRTNKLYQSRNGNLSEFLSLNNVNNLRK
jgi:superfamily I DNA/RNA helicase